jgi:hypothetical protein
MRKTIHFAIIAVFAVVGVRAVAQESSAVQERLDNVKEKVRAELQALDLAKMAVESRITPGAPYSAEAVTESVQVLADGNRIVRRSTMRVFRDGEGRTRREQINSNGVDVDSVSISDPVAEATYVLDPRERIAFHNGVIIATPNGASIATVSPRARGGTITTARNPDGSVAVSASEVATATAVDVRKREEEVGAQARTATVAAAGGRGGRVGGAGFGAAVPPNPREGETGREDLGQQTIEGVVATGTRSTTTIAAGAIGNEQPIKIVSEQWFSPDLKVLVLTKHSDPRVGETTYRLANIVRADQPRSLFEVPPDYTVKESFIRRENR